MLQTWKLGQLLLVLFHFFTKLFQSHNYSLYNNYYDILSTYLTECIIDIMLLLVIIPVQRCVINSFKSRDGSGHANVDT